MNNIAREKILALVPKICPACGAKLTLSADLMHLKCPNKDCSGSLYRRLEIMAKAFGIDNIGVKTAQSLVEDLNMQSEVQLFHLSVEDIMQVGRFQKGMAERIYNSIHKVTEVPFAKFIRGCCISRVGEGTAEDLARIYPTLKELLATTPAELKKLYDKAADGLAEIITTSLKAREHIIIQLADEVKIIYDDSQAAAPVQDANILAVVTGPLHFGSRPEFQNYTKTKFGVRWTSSVSKNVDYLVTNETAETAKYKDAKRLQSEGHRIKIITEDEFLKMFGEGSSVEAFLNNQGASKENASVMGAAFEI